MKTKHFHWFMVVCVISLLASNGFQSARVTAKSNKGPVSPDSLTLLTSNEDGVSFHIQVPWENLKREEVLDSGTAYTRLALPGWQNMSQQGAPALPYKLVTIGVPFGAKLSVSVQVGRSHVIDLQAPVVPALRQVVMPEDSFDPTGKNLPQVKDQIVMDDGLYGQAGSFPSDLVRVSNDGVMRGQRLAAIALYPVQYNPVEGSLNIYEEMWVEIQFSEVSRLPAPGGEPDASVFADLLDDILINYNQARNWRQPASVVTDTLSGNSTWEVPSPAWKVAVVDEGFYEISRQDLEAVGFPVDTPTPENIRMFNQGQEVALDVRLDAFDEVESIVFYGQAIESKYTVQNVYWLAVGSQPGLRIGQRSGAPTGADIPENYPHELYLEQNHIYRAIAPGGNNLDRFFWAMLYPPGTPSWTYTFTLQNQPFAASGTMRVDLLGLNSFSNIYPDHHVVFYLNNVYLGETWFDGRTWQNVQLTLPIGLLQAGENTIRLMCPLDTGGVSDLVMLDRIQLDFSDSFTAEEGELTFSYPTPGNWLFEVSGMQEGAPVRVFDITSKVQAMEIVDFSIASGILSFQDELGGAATYRIQKTDNYLAAASIEADTPSSLKAAGNGADFIVISHADFLDAASTLAAYRETADFRTFTTDVQDVYDEFSYGIISPYAIRNFLAYTQGNWQGIAPAYVLLVGDGHYDPNNYLGFGRVSYIPPFLGMFDPNAGETAADNRYVTFDGDEDRLADMMIGRLSVNTLVEANAMVNKFLAYEALPPEAEDWQRQVLFIADEGAFFANTSEYLAVNYVESVNFTANRVYQGVSPHETLAQARAAIQAQIDAGNLFVNYIGHGSVNSWGNGGLLTTNDINSLNNTYKVPIALPMTCYEGYFTYPYPLATNVEALAEVFTRKPQGGALASWSASGTGVATGHFSLNAGFYEAYFNDAVGTLGEATTAGKLALWATDYALDLLDTYHLFGDPAIVFKRGLTAVSDDYELDENASLDVLAADGVLSNEINPDNLLLEAELVPGSGPTNGTLEFNSDGSFSYTPNPDWHGLDRFSYRAVSGETQSNPARVNLMVLSTNHAPVGVPDEYSTSENTPLEVPAERGVLANDTDEDGEFLTAQLYSTASFGALIFHEDGSFEYYPYSYITGTDSFTYRAYDGEDYSAITTVTINLTPLDDAPVAFPDNYSTFPSQLLYIDSPGVLRNDYDPEGLPLIAELVTGPSHGTLILNTNGSFSYTPESCYLGSDVFTYRAFDGGLYSDPATVTISIEAFTTVFLPLTLR